MITIDTGGVIVQIRIGTFADISIIVIRINSNLIKEYNNMLNNYSNYNCQDL